MRSSRKKGRVINRHLSPRARRHTLSCMSLVDMHKVCEASRDRWSHRWLNHNGRGHGREVGATQCATEGVGVD
jgi:hypothetical protein